MRLWVDSDTKTLLLLSWITPTVPATAQYFYLKFFNLIATAWTPAVSAASNTLINGVYTFEAPQVVYTPKMDAVAVTYKASATGGSTTRIFKLAIATATFTEYTLPATFTATLTGASNYVYFDESTAVTYLQLISLSSAVS